MVDVIASYFVPVVISIAIITFIVWYFFGPHPALTYAFPHFVSVLISHALALWDWQLPLHHGGNRERRRKWEF